MNNISRYFNRIVQTKAGIWKFGNPEKIKNEYFWFRFMRNMNLPISGFVYVPRRLVEGKNISGYLMPRAKGVSLDYYFEKAGTVDRLIVVEHVLDWLSYVQPAQAFKISFENKASNFYINGTLKRINRYLQKVLDDDAEQFLMNWKKLNAIIDTELVSNIDENVGFIHGDLNFSNIFIDGRKITCIDPRGTFFDTEHCSCIGDIRYDYAKLRQCYDGYYHILALVNDSDNADEVKQKIKKRRENDVQLVNNLDEKIISRGLSLRQIKLIELLQFIRMIPLHADSRVRQEVMFGLAVEMMDQF